MKWIGLTGGIATGKSTVKRMLDELNIAVIDADQISHELTQKGAEGYEKIVSHFGKDILDTNQNLNRQQLGNIVFNQPEQLQHLESILHPLIQVKVQRQRKDFHQLGHSLCFYDVPLLFEKNLESQFDQIVLVYAPLTTQVDRIMLRNNLSHTQALARIHAQIPITQKIHRSDFCLDNSTNTADLKLQVINLIKILSQSPT